MPRKHFHLYSWDGAFKLFAYAGPVRLTVFSSRWFSRKRHYSWGNAMFRAGLRLLLVTGALGSLVWYIYANPYPFLDALTAVLRSLFPV